MEFSLLTLLDKPEFNVYRIEEAKAEVHFYGNRTWVKFHFRHWTQAFGLAKPRRLLPSVLTARP